MNDTAAGSASCQLLPATGSPKTGAGSAAHGAEHTRGRRKRWAAKTRTGCLTCRSRRVKCDEGQPECKRCVIRGVKCEQSPAQLVRAAPNLLIYQPRESLGPAGVEVDDRQLHTFNLFRRKTAKQIAGSFDHAFWTDNVVRAAKEYPTIWYATLAVAAVHERSSGLACSKRVQQEQFQYEAFALQQYSTSINCLVRLTLQDDLSLNDKETVLLSSILYTGLCCLQGDLKQAVSHIRNGIRLFYEWFPEDDEGSEEEHRQQLPEGAILNPRSLLIIMKQFEIQFANRFGQDQPAIENRRLAPPECSSRPFTSATQAYFEFQPLLTSLLELGRHRGLPTAEAPQPAEDVRLAHRREFGVWNTKFRKLQRMSRLSAADREGIQVLEMLWTSVQIVLHVNMHESVQAFDRFEPIYRKIADQAEELLNLRNAKAGKAKESPSGFSYSLAASEVLYFAGIHCWKPTTRQRIISLLDRWPAQDGVWDTQLVAAICKAVMTFEQRGWTRCMGTKSPCGCIAGEYICGGHRLLEHDVNLCGPRVASITMRTRGDLDEYSNTTVEIAW